jgi:hypothetical protein
MLNNLFLRAALLPAGRPQRRGQSAAHGRSKQMAVILLSALLCAPTAALADSDGPALRYNRANEFSIVDMNTESSVVFSVDYHDPSGINLKSIRVFINDEDVTKLATITDKRVTVVFTQPEAGLYHARVVVHDNAGNRSSIEWDLMYQAC